MTVPFFPFTIPADETPHYTASCYDFRPVFMAHRPKDMTWFAYDVIVKSRDEIEFVVFDMRCNVSGGIGKEIGRIPAVVPEVLTLKHINDQARRRAIAKREWELHNAEKRIIERYTAQFLEDIAA
jgi:hypothetical protein